MVTIELPDLPRDFAFSGLSFSCLPTSSDCIVFGASTLTCDLVNICYLRLGEEAWTWSQYRNCVKIILCNNNPVFFDGAFYCLSYERLPGVFHLEGGSCDWTVLRMAEPYKSVDQNYLVQCDGNLLSIYVGPKGKWVSIYKLVTWQNELKWSPVYDLGDQMVLVSRSTSISMKVVTKGMKNKIYFPITFGGKDNYVYYSLATSAWHSSFDNYPRSDIYYTQEQLHCTWIQPTLLSENVLS